MKVLMTEHLGSVREHRRDCWQSPPAWKLRFVPQDATLTAAAWRPDVAVLDAPARCGAPGNIGRPEEGMAGHGGGDLRFFFEPYHREAYLRDDADCFFDKLLAWSELIKSLRRRQADAAPDSMDARRLALRNMALH